MNSVFYLHLFKLYLHSERCYKSYSVKANKEKSKNENGNELNELISLGKFPSTGKILVTFVGRKT